LREASFRLLCKLLSSSSKFKFPHLHFFSIVFLLVASRLLAQAEVTSVSVQSPSLVTSGTTSLISPIHLQATAEDTAIVTGYVVYVDNVNVFRNFSPSVDAWIALPPGKHALYVKAWDAHSNLATQTYAVDVVGFAPPNPPVHAHRFLNIDNAKWTVDNSPPVGGECNHGSIAPFSSNTDPNTSNLPAFDGNGQHFVLRSGCTYDDSLFYRKYNQDPNRLATHTNFLWDFWFYIPTSTRNDTIQALEHDLFQSVQLGDGVHEFMFGSQCNYITNQWQIWLPRGDKLVWADTGISSCRFATGTWHHATYFLQRVTPGGYQEIPRNFSPASDLNTSLRYGTLTIDGQTEYLGAVSWSTIPKPAWSPVLGVQHQLDSSESGVTIEEYVDGESLIAW
jgi:hypothetical protein